MNANRITTKTIAVIVAVVMLVACGAASAYALFTSEWFKTITGQISNNGSVTTVEVSSYADLYKYVGGNADGSLFNDGSATTTTAQRIVLKFTKDITLEYNLVVTADCHIDLNGKTLYLNGNYLVLSHAYYGSTIVKNGKIVLDKYVEKTDDATTTELVLGKLYFVTPNAAASVEDVSFALRSGTAKTAADCVVDLGANQAVLAYNALRIVTNKLANGVDGLVNTPDFDTLAAKTDTEFAADTLLYAKACYADGDNAEKHACVFAFADLDLPTHVLAYDGYTVEYTSSNTAVLTDFGKVTPSASGIGTANLTITVKHDGTTVGQTTLCVHVVDVTRSSQLVACGKSLVSAYMQGFYSQQESTYLFKRSTQLPRKVGTAGHYAELAYKTFSDGQLTNEVTDTIKTYDNYVMLEPTSAVKYLQVTVTANGNSSTLVYSVTASDAGLVRTQASYAQDFVVENYGGKISLSRTGDTTAITPDFTTKTLVTPKTGNAHESIVSILYSLINDTNSLYTLTGCGSALTADSDNGLLSVAEGKNPLNYIQTVQLNCKFTFDNGEAVEIQIPIECTSDQSENINPFLVHYNNYDQMFFTNTACYTTKTFEMPFATGDGDSDYIVCYDMLGVDSDNNFVWNSLQGIAVSLYYNQTDHFLTATTGGFKDYTNYVNALNAHLDEVDGTSRNKAVKKILDYGDSKWVFYVYTSATTDQAALPDYNQNFEFVYNYRLVASSGGNFTRYDDSSDVPVGTAFTLPGILIYNANTTTASDGIITDINMYTWMYETFGTDNDGYQSGKVVLTDWLKQSIAVDVTSGKGQTYLANASNLNGLQYIVGATYVNLSGMNLAASSAAYEANLGYISQMAAVETLILQNCKLSTVGNISASNPVDTVLAKLTALKNITTLKLDNKYNNTTNANTIHSFEFLTSIASLNRVYVSNNLSTSTIAGVFYGSQGLVNMAYFDELVGAGVTVYNVNAGSDVAFTETTGINDYKTLQGIEYQTKLTGNQSITTVYECFVGATHTDFGLKTSYTVGTSTTPITVTNASISWSYEGTDPTKSTRFYVNYTFTLSGTTVTIQVGFDVVRVAATTTQEAGQ